MVENIEGFPAPVAVGTGVVTFLALVGANLMGGTNGLGGVFPLGMGRRSLLGPIGLGAQRGDLWMVKWAMATLLGNQKGSHRAKISSIFFLFLSIFFISDEVSNLTFLCRASLDCDKRTLVIGVHGDSHVVPQWSTWTKPKDSTHWATVPLLKDCTQ